ncbi:MAG: response regulator transcription factor [Alteromonadaceae bacterium]|nr:response regulator transcription factor [Alteromonadaceae bacterium]
MRILLVEDDIMISNAITLSLKDADYAVDEVSNGESALTACSCQQYDLILLDLTLPKVDGLAVLKAIRKKSEIPVIIITARDSLNERIVGLDLGADDYLLKPFDLTELLARIRAVLRRKNGSAQPVLTNGFITLDPVSHEVSLPSIEPQILSSREYMLLQALLIRPGAILSRSELEDKIYSWGEEVESNAIEFIIYSLRKKIGKERIINVRGLGWMVQKKQ